MRAFGKKLPFVNVCLASICFPLSFLGFRPLAQPLSRE
jgi:hypothetical protein